MEVREGGGYYCGDFLWGKAGWGGGAGDVGGHDVVEAEDREGGGEVEQDYGGLFAEVVGGGVGGGEQGEGDEVVEELRFAGTGGCGCEFDYWGGFLLAWWGW